VDLRNHHRAATNILPFVSDRPCASSCCSRWRWPRLPPCARRRRRWRARASEIFCLPTRGIASGKARVVCNSGDSVLSEAVMPLSVFGWRPCGRTTVFSLSLSRALSLLSRSCLSRLALSGCLGLPLVARVRGEGAREREREREKMALNEAWALRAAWRAGGVDGVASLLELRLCDSAFEQRTTQWLCELIDAEVQCARWAYYRRVVVLLSSRVEPPRPLI